jgi:hypothetical protein
MDISVVLYKDTRMDHEGQKNLKVQNGSKEKTGQGKKKIPVWAKFFAAVQTGPEAHPASCTMGNESLSRGYSGRAWS